MIFLYFLIILVYDNYFYMENIIKILKCTINFNFKTILVLEIKVVQKIIHDITQKV